MEQTIVLEYQPQPSTHVRNFAIGQTGQILTIEKDTTAGGPFNQRGQTQQSALAGTGMTGDKDHFTPFHMETDTLQGIATAWIMFTYLIELQHV